MSAFKKVTESNFTPGEGNDRFPVYSKQFNELVDDLAAGTRDLSALNLEVSDTLSTDTIAELTSGAGVTIDGVLLKDSGVSLHSATSEFTVLTTLTATEIVGSAAGDIGHANGATLVADPASTYTYQLVSVVCIYDFDTAAYTGGANDLVVAYNSGGATLTGVCTTAKLLGAAGDKLVVFYPLAAAAGDLVVGTGFSLRGTAYTQPGTAAGVLRVYTTYKRITTGL